MDEFIWFVTLDSSCSPIESVIYSWLNTANLVITRMITEPDYRPNWTLLRPITITLQTNCDKWVRLPATTDVDLTIVNLLNLGQMDKYFLFSRFLEALYYRLFTDALLWESRKSKDSSSYNWTSGNW